MVTISNFVVLGIIEVYALFIVGVVLLVFYNRSLSNRILNLRAQLTSLKEKLSKKGGNTGSQTLNQVDKPSDDYLGKAISETKSQFTSIAADAEISLNEDYDTPTLTTALRHQFLVAEQNADSCENDKDKWASLEDSLFIILEQIQLLKKIDDKVPEETTTNFEEQWKELCDAALKLWNQRSSKTEEDFMGLMQLINSELGHEQLVIPERKSLSERRREDYNKSVDSLNQLKESATDNKKLIAQLLSARDAAESEVSIKADELQKLQRFLNESEVCIQLLEDELDELRNESKDATPSETAEMQELIQNFAKESSEMLTCIDTLERENSELRDQLGPTE